MSATVSDYLLYRLTQWGIRRIYGYPGDGINGILGALGRNSELQFIQTRHEEMAAFMACAHAKFTGEPGVCLATSGPGAIHLLNGLYDAKLDHQPVVAIVGQQKSMGLGGHYQQEVDLLSLFKDVASEYVTQVSHPSAIRHAVDRALRIARAERTVTCVIIPNDIQEQPYQSPPHKHGSIHSSVGYCEPRVVPQEKDLRRAADVLNAGKKVAILVGAGALGAAEELMEVADLLGTGVAKALLGKAVLPDDLPFVTGPIGLLGTRPSWDMMMGCDTLLMVGTSFPYSEFLPPDGQARGVQIDLDGRMLAIRYPMEVPLTGDSKETLRALIPLLKRKEDRSWRESLEKGIRQWWKVLEGQAMNAADPINPQRVFWELSPKLPDEVILTADSGSATNWYARDLKVRKGMMASLSGNLATMGCGVPYAIGAKFAFPHRPVIAAGGRRRHADEWQRGAHHRGQVLEGVEGPALHRAGAQQPGPQPGDVGAARAGGRPEAPGHAGPARLPLCAVRGLPGAQGHPGGPARAARPRVGRGPERHEARRLRGLRGPERAAPAAAHHPRAGQALRPIHDEGR